MNAPPKSVTFRIGQAVSWRSAPMGLAQICELRRRRVRICYPCKNGRIRSPIVSIAALLREPLLIPLENPFNRALLPRPRERTFEL